MALLNRRVAAVGVALGGVLLSLAGCESDVLPSPTPGLLAAHAYVLAPRQVPGYTQSGDTAVSPATLADQHHDPALADRLSRQGFLDGALALFGPPKKATKVLPFQTISSQAVIFGTADGAAAFFAEEQQRVNVPPPQGTIAPLVAAPNLNTDDFVAYDSSAPPATPGDPSSRAFLALLRRGQVVVELYGAAGPNSATPDQFIGYISLEEQLLQVPVRG